MRNPCRECPFRKESMPGYLGECSHDPETFIQQIEGPAMPCHLTVNWNTKKPDFSKSKECVGALQFMNNSFKLSRDKETATLQKVYGKSEDVFKFRKDFIDHHKK